MPGRAIPLSFALDLRRSLRSMQLGRHDPTVCVTRDTLLRATRTPQGPATLQVHHRGDQLDAEAWGDGAEWALAMAPSTLGAHDDRVGFDPVHPLVADLHRRSDGLRLPRTERVIEALVPPCCHRGSPASRPSAPSGSWWIAGASPPPAPGT